MAAKAFEESTGIHVEAAQHKQQQSGSGEGGAGEGSQKGPATGTTKFDLLHPAGRVLWIVREDEPAESERGELSWG